MEETEYCPKCGGTSGFKFNRYVQEEVSCRWPGQFDNPEEEMEFESIQENMPTLNGKTVKCLDCGSRVSKKDAGPRDVLAY